MTPTAPTFAHHDALAALGRSLQATGYRFVTVTPATHRRVNNRPENAWAHDLRGVFGWSRPYRTGVLPETIDGQLRAAGLAVPEGPDGWRADVRASTIGDHLYFHSAWPTSDEDAVFFGPDTYRYTSALTRMLGPHGALRRPVRRAIDIGAGAGPGAIELALRCPDATVYAADINPAALALADVNAGLNGAHNVVPCRSDLLDGIDGGFDLVMSNPPYILDPDELTYRHGGGTHGAELSIRIVHAALDRLHPGGSLLLYTGVAIVDGADPFLAAIRDRLDADTDGWSYEELDPDVFGGQLGCEGYENVERIAAVWLHAIRRG
ncbi:class I SAM-dependent methyltransferase [Telluria mixta]|uniref:Class I SAM-dependent methyltransferase n=1 Tax=Telluria mixta TaxID=34071 RepID=A0ABT2C8A3_9BURK|nr:class I SAM-dependent methyltransferase [Telluria mixta]MCS0633591.1 class I SAM-dependent methyltransferase [Telluria mixta]WEM95943.1 class I SAM-dependent methyltransferase [Telluria mixta]